MDIKTADRLIEFRKKAGLSQEDLANKLGVSRQAVSKWERVEASPDTDNLIALAKLYNVSLDELLGLNDNKQEENKEESKEDKTENINSHVYVDDGEKVTIQDGEIHVESKDGEHVHISAKGIHVKDGKDEFTIGHPESNLIPIVESVSALVITITYILLGCLYKGKLGTTQVSAWAGLWPLFFCVPIPGSTISAIKHKRICRFAFPFLITAIYCFIGMLLGLWHPLWVIFLFIPIFYTIFGYVDKEIHRRKAEKLKEENIIDNKE